MLQKLRKRIGREEGFTLIELLVVMLILGILAAIAIPTFFNQRQKAQDADAKAAVRSAQTAIETYATDNGGDYTGATFARLDAIENTLNDVGDNRISIIGTPNGTDYTVRSTSATGRTFDIVRTAGNFAFNCAAVGGGCPTGGWGG